MPLTRQQAAGVAEGHVDDEASQQQQQQLIDHHGQRGHLSFGEGHTASAWHDGMQDLYHQQQQQQHAQQQAQHHAHPQFQHQPQHPHSHPGTQPTPRRDVFTSPMTASDAEMGGAGGMAGMTGMTGVTGMSSFNSASQDSGAAFYADVNASPHDVMVTMTPSPGSNQELGQLTQLGQPPHSAGAAMGLGLSTTRQFPQAHAHHRHSSLGQMGAIAQRHSPYSHGTFASVQTPLRMGPTSPLTSGGGSSSSSSMSRGPTSPLTGVAPGRITRTGTTPNMANMAIFTNSNAAFNSNSAGVRASSPGGTSSAASTSFNSPVSFTAAQGFSPNDSMRGMAPSMDSRDTSIDSRDASMDSRDLSSSMGSFTASASASASESRASSMSASFSDDFFPRACKKKVKLLNIDRKRICEQHEANPKLKQEDLANMFGVERSTVSKVLKDKERWLSVEEDSVDAKIVKHRQARFPELEKQLSLWAHSAQAAGQTLTDASIKNRALELAKAIGGPTEKFKASGGWVDKFRARTGLRKHVPGSGGPSGSSSQDSTSASASASGSGSQGMDVREFESLPSTLSPTGPPDYSLPRYCHSMPSTSHGRLEPVPATPLDMATTAIDGDVAMGIRTTPTSKQKRHYDAIAADRRAVQEAMATHHPDEQSALSYGMQDLHESKRRRAGDDDSGGGGGLGSPFSELGSRRQHDVGVGSSDNLAARFASADTERQRQQHERHEHQPHPQHDHEHHASQQQWRTTTTTTSPLRPLRLSDLGRSNTSPGFGGQQQSQQQQQQAHDMSRKSSFPGLGADDSGLGSDSLLGDHSSMTSGSQSQLMQASRSLGGGDFSFERRRMSPRSSAMRRMLESAQRSPRSRSPTSRDEGDGSHATMHPHEMPPVSLDQARNSLDVVIQFLEENPTESIPRSHFLTLGSLHGSLAAAAERTPHPQPHPQHQHHQHQHRDR